MFVLNTEHFGYLMKTSDHSHSLLWELYQLQHLVSQIADGPKDAGTINFYFNPKSLTLSILHSIHFYISFFTFPCRLCHTCFSPFSVPILQGKILDEVWIEMRLKSTGLYKQARTVEVSFISICSCMHVLRFELHV